MLFSIATPCLNALPRLKKCIGSVRGQQGVAVEHLLQDGASSDGTLAWLGAQDNLNADSRPDRGMYEAINRAWARSSGDILSWLNADEQYLPGSLAAVESAFNNRPELDMVWGNVILVDRAGRPLAARREVPLRLQYLRNVELYAFSCTMFFRRRLWDCGLLRLDDSLKISADADLILRLLQNGICIEHIPAFIALFELTGNNLLTLQWDTMLNEISILKRRHGSCRTSFGRGAVRALRYAEKLVAGCWRASTVEYDYAVDDVPTFQHIPPTRLGFRFTSRPDPQPGAEP